MKRRKKDEERRHEQRQGLTDGNVGTSEEVTIVTAATPDRTMAEHFRPGLSFRIRIFPVVGISDVDIFNVPGQPLLYRRIGLGVDERKPFGAAAETVRGRPVFGPGPWVPDTGKAGRSGKGRLATPDRKLLRFWNFRNFFS